MNFKLCKLVVITIILLTLFVVSVNAREITIPMIKTPFPVKCVTWNKDGKTFAYSEENNILIRDSDNLSMKQTISTNHGIIEFLQFTQSTSGEGLDQLATLTQNNVLDVRILPDPEPMHTVEGLTQSIPIAMAYNHNGNYIATASSDGKVFLYLQNYMTGAMIERQLQGAKSPARSLCFSRDNKFLAVASIDDAIHLYDVSSGTEIKSYPYKSSLNIPVRFTLDSKSLVYAKNSSTISVLNIKSNKVKNFQTLRDIYSLEVSADGKQLVVLSDDNQIYFYDLKNGDFLQYIPSFNTSPITCYAFNNKDSRLAVGHKDGSLYILNLNDVILLPQERPDSLTYTTPTDPNPQTPETPEDKKEEKPEKNETPKAPPRPARETVPAQPLPTRRTPHTYQTGHGIIIEGGVSFPPNPFTIEFSLDLGYENFDLIKPFYFGGIISPFFAIPNENFPYVYKNNGELLTSPYLTGFKLFLPVGFLFTPFDDEVFAFAELDLGFSTNLIWNGQIGAAGTTSSPFPAFYVAAKVGLGWRFLHITASGSYDAIMNFSFDLGIGGRIYLEKKAAGGEKNED